MLQSVNEILKVILLICNIRCNLNTISNGFVICENPLSDEFALQAIKLI